MHYATIGIMHTSSTTSVRTIGILEPPLYQGGGGGRMVIFFPKKNLIKVELPPNCLKLLSTTPNDGRDSGLYSQNKRSYIDTIMTYRFKSDELKMIQQISLVNSADLDFIRYDVTNRLQYPGLVKLRQPYFKHMD